MNKIAKSLAMIAFVAAIAVGATSSFFSDVETSTNNTFTAGTIDISVDGQNPWNDSWQNYLDKPCETNYMNFVIKNVGENPANIWKRLTNVVNGPGTLSYSTTGTAVASSEPEYEAGGGANYVERDNLSAFMVYDMAICVSAAVDDTTLFTDCPLIDGTYANGLIVDNTNKHARPALGAKWEIVIDEADQVRVDNVVDTWIKLNDALASSAVMVVSQSYHLMTWDDSGQPMITNWAQGDTMTFDVELDARQLTAPAPGTTMSGDDVVATVGFVKQDPISWNVLSNNGTMTYDVEGTTFDYSLDVNGLVANTNYCLIYYADGWPGNNPGAFIKAYNTGASTVINDPSGTATLTTDIPNSSDANYPVGGKVWLVLCADYNSGSNSTGPMTGWNPGSYLFDDGLVNYNLLP